MGLEILINQIENLLFIQEVNKSYQNQKQNSLLNSTEFLVLLILNKAGGDISEQLLIRC